MANDRSKIIGKTIGNLLAPVIAGGVIYLGAWLAFSLVFSWRGLGGSLLMSFGAWWLIAKSVESGVEVVTLRYP